MEQPKISLEQLQIATPCPAAWAEMHGDDGKRYCGHCSKHVHRLSAMTRAAAEKLVCESAGSLCAIMEFAPTGEVLTLDYAPAKPRGRWRRFGPLALLSATMTASLAAMAGGNRGTAATVPAGRIRATMGEMVAPAVQGKVAFPPATRPGDGDEAPTSQPAEQSANVK